MPGLAGCKPVWPSAGSGSRHCQMDVADLMPSSRTLTFVDVALAVWVALWIALGVAIGIEVGNLTGLSHTVVLEGRTIETVGRTLRPLSGVPFVGGDISHAATQIRQAGASAVVSGRSSASSIDALSVLLAIAVAVLPSVPVLGLYLPWRLQRSRPRRRNDPHALHGVAQDRS